uniref:Sodium/hydrogen exchanger n=1 Tax=Phallusia mammillata TaxID=59560 RepID=A0A6F9DTP4_9ASCI|nr:sodium/hydrogen exchanger 3-like [Phallusia mammillata]
MKQSWIVYLFVVCVCVLALALIYPKPDENVLWKRAHIRHIRSTNASAGNATHSTSVNRFPVAVVNWERVSNPYLISMWIIFAGLAKLGFHLIHKVVRRVPESCILICVGLIVGGIAYAIDPNHRIEQLLFNPDTFFLFILPPIVMEAGYFMPKEPFFDNLGTILTYAIIGTIFNAFAIGGSLFAVSTWGLTPGVNLTILECLLFGSIISAVDPVAVISVFEEIHVNTVLYICVFGESLLNDGVAVVLFKMFEGYIHIGQNNIIAIDIVAAIASFFVVAFGGLFIGVVFGYLGSFITKYTVHNRIIEPTFVFVLCYLAYLSAEVFHLSGIIAIVFAAFTMSAYVEHNISSKSHTTVKYGMKMLANIAETIIFMLLGIAAVSDFWQYWNTGFVFWTLLFITIYRVIGVLSLTWIINCIRIDKISKVDQFVMAYGGLRGAIAFSLVSLTSPELVPPIKTMICACIVAILFTSFVQGSTIRPFVELLKVRTADKHRKTMFEDVNLRLIEHLMTGIEDVTGHHGHHYWTQRFLRFNAEYLSRWFIREPYKCRDLEILETFHRINKREAVDLAAEYERAGSSGEMKLTGTMANLLLPYEMRRSYSQASFNTMVREHGVSDAIIDMRALEVQNKSKAAIRSTEDADVHHVLQQNMYKPRTRDPTRHRRGYIDEDPTRKRQEQEILIRHKIQQRRQHKHYKHKHTRHKPRNSSKSPLAKPPSNKSIKKVNSLDEETTKLLAPTFVVDPNVDESKSQEVSHEDPGITFTVGNNNAGLKNGRKLARNPLGFMSSFETLPEEISSDVASEPTDVTHVDGGGLELPWKSMNNNEAAVSDPHVTSSEQGKGFELWPRDPNRTPESPQKSSEEVPTVVVTSTSETNTLDENMWESIPEDNV